MNVAEDRVQGFQLVLEEILLSTCFMVRRSDLANSLQKLRNCGGMVNLSSYTVFLIKHHVDFDSELSRTWSIINDRIIP